MAGVNHAIKRNQFANGTRMDSGGAPLRSAARVASTVLRGLHDDLHSGCLMIHLTIHPPPLTVGSLIACP